VIGLRAWMPSDDPNTTLCLYRRITHRECATCGMTRALALLVRGDVRGSFARHPLAPPVAAEAALAWGLVPIVRRRGLRVPPLWRDRILLGNAAAFLGVWIARLLTGH
jgi:hypothetical protein